MRPEPHSRTARPRRSWLAARHVRSLSASPAQGSPGVLMAVKTVHTLAWLSIESCMIYLLAAGLRGRSGRRAAIAGAVVAAESVVFTANGLRCPLTTLAEHHGAEHGSVTDVYLPRWFAHHLPAIHVPLIVAAGYLHARNVRQARAEPGSTEVVPMITCCSVK